MSDSNDFKGQLFNLTLGLHVQTIGGVNKSYGGVVYPNLPEKQVAVIQQMYLDHAPELLEGMKPLLDKLAEMGIQKAERHEKEISSRSQKPGQ